jgi:hypothetical protein
MTVIKDPGNNTDSYSDGQPRLWGPGSTSTAHLWKFDANDTVGQNSDSLGNQLWRTTANTWHSRANQAYDGGSWGVGTLWSTDSATWQSRANQAYDSGTWGSGNLWSTDAGGDPGVYTNRYNAGHTQGVTDANNALPAAYQLTPTTNSTSYTTSETTLMTITANRTGYWWAAGSIINADGGTASNVTVNVRMAGTVQATVTYFNFVNGGAGSGLVCTSTPVLLSSGQTITLTASMSSGSVPTTTPHLAAGFVPTPSYPH